MKTRILTFTFCLLVAAPVAIAAPSPGGGGTGGGGGDSTFDSTISNRAVIGDSGASVETESDPKFQLPKSSHPLMPKLGRDCTGTSCSLEADIYDFEGEQSGQMAVNAPSPFSAFSESVSSGKLSALYNDMSKSDFALTQATWAMVEPAFFSAMNAAGNTALQMSTARFLAEQNAREAFAANGQAGEFLAKSYSSCVANLTRRGKSFSAAQEACLGAWNYGIADKAAATKFEDINVAEGDRLHFKFHPDHPLYVELDNTGATVHSNEMALKTCGFNDPAYVPSDPKERAFTLLLTDLMFTQPMVRASKAGENKRCKYLVDFRSDWVRLFGDVIYSVNRPNEQASAVAGNPLPGQTMLTLSTRRFTPTFEYLPGYAQPGFKTQTAFKKFMIARVDQVYAQLMSVMYKRCKFNASTGSFWKIDSASSDGLSKQDFQRLSSSAYPFSQDVGDLLFMRLASTLPGEINTSSTTTSGVDACKVLDPSASDSPAKIDYLIKQDSQNSAALSVLRFAYKFSQNIAAGQINDLINELRKMVMGITGGQMESKARDFAMQLINDVAGNEWNFDEATQKIQGEYVKDIIALQQAQTGTSAFANGQGGR